MHSRAYNYGYYPQTESSFFNLSADIWKNCMECKQEDSVYISKYNYCQRLTASIEEVLEGKFQFHYNICVAISSRLANWFEWRLEI